MIEAGKLQDIYRRGKLMSFAETLDRCTALDASETFLLEKVRRTWIPAVVLMIVWVVPCSRVANSGTFGHFTQSYRANGYTKRSQQEES